MSYVITYDCGDGYFVEPDDSRPSAITSSIDSGQSFTLPPDTQAHREGYDLIGWYDPDTDTTYDVKADGTFNSLVYSWDADKTFEAVWQKQRCDVTVIHIQVDESGNATIAAKDVYSKAKDPGKSWVVACKNSDVPHDSEMYVDRHGIVNRNMVYSNAEAAVWEGYVPMIFDPFSNPAGATPSAIIDGKEYISSLVLSDDEFIASEVVKDDNTSTLCIFYFRGYYDVKVKDHGSPIVNISQTQRCDEDLASNEEGEYAKVTFDVSANQDIPGMRLRLITIILCHAAVNGSAEIIGFYDIPFSGINYTSSELIRDRYGTPIKLDVDKQYRVQVVVTDIYNGFAETGADVLKAFITMDFKAGGHGICFGGQAVDDGFTCEMDANFKSALAINGDLELGTSAKSSLVDLIYPVGSIYMSANNVSPTALFGGTWEKIEGRFLLGTSSTYTLGAKDGEATHTLTAAEMPTHSHGMNGHTHSVGAHAHGLNGHTHNMDHVHPLGARNSSNEGNQYGLAQSTAFSGRILVNYQTGDNTQHFTWGPRESGSITAAYKSNTGGNSGNTANSSAFNSGGSTANSTDAGSSGAHNNMPPYLVVNIWKRTA